MRIRRIIVRVAPAAAEADGDRCLILLTQIFIIKHGPGLSINKTTHLKSIGCRLLILSPLANQKQK